MPSRAKTLTAVMSAAALVAFSGCQSGGTGGSDDKSIEVLMPSTSNPYYAQWLKGFESIADEAGYDVDVKQGTGQSEVNQRAQEVLASGKKPSAYVWFTQDNSAGLAALKQLAQTGTPVVTANQPPPEGFEADNVIYAGVGDVELGRVAGTQLIDARDHMKASGAKLGSPGGNAVLLGFPEGTGATVLRQEGLEKGIAGSGIDLIKTFYADGYDATSGYKAMSSNLPALRNSDIDLVAVQSDALAEGAAQALKQAGYKIGKDVEIVGGNCGPNLLKDGITVGSQVQAPEIEGIYTAAMTIRYAKSGGKATKGSTVDDDIENKPALTGPVYDFNYMPAPGIDQSNFNKLSVWGLNYDQLCLY